MRQSLTSSCRRRLTTREVVLASLALGVVCIGLTDRLLTRAAARRYHERYDAANVVGRTKAQLRSRLGPPWDESGDSWTYQEGMDPDATIEFRDGRAVRVERYKDSVFRQ